jgi:Domain of unknown function (DUF1707)
MAGDLEGWSHGGDDRARLRISDDDRHRVAELLRVAAGEGRLDIEELEERLESAYAAKTYADLVPITADLPGSRSTSAPVVPPTGPLLPAVRYDSSVAIMGSTSRTGVWEVGPSHTAVTIMGNVDIDLRSARFTSRETVIRVFAFWGAVNVYVNARTRLVVDGVGIMGAFDQARDKVDAEIGPDSPVVRVTGASLMAGVTVQRRSMPGEGKRRLRGRPS